MTRPDVEATLAPLKSFQRRTVDHAFDRLFLASDSTSRFLVADEVGLGKTLVARGVIARTIDHLWDTVPRIDILYICSNTSIARANLPKLQVGNASERSFALATRLTMLATQLAPQEGRKGLTGSKLNFVSFTPGTSFELGRSAGDRRERAILYHLIEPFVESETPLMNLLQGQIKRTRRWRDRLLEEDTPLDPDIQARFEDALEGRPDLLVEMDELIERWFHRTRQHWPAEARDRRNRLIGDLRQLLAEVCVHALEPDLVILDEFQRFKRLLETREEKRDPAAELAQTLFQAKTPQGQPVRTLLLSATPYKLYTSDAEIEQEDHYEDFLATTRFLLGNDEPRVEDLRGRLARFGRALKAAANGDAEGVLESKEAVEEALRSVMARTERVAASEDRDAMVEEPKVSLEMTPGDVRQYLAADALFKAVGDRDPMAFWKSAPYLPNFMRGYKFNERLDESIDLSCEQLAKVLRAHAAAFLNADQLRDWAVVDPGNAKLRELSRDLLDSGLWKLLWMPPTVPYWPLEGAFQGHEGRTKSLLFSAWNVVPDVVSGVLSYEAERRMVGGQLESYLDPAVQQRPLLRLTQTASGERSRHRLLLLMLPCLPLADLAHPLSAPSGHDRRAWVRSAVDALLADPALPNPQDGEVDHRWEWAAPVLLDRGLKRFLFKWRDDEELPRPNPDVFPRYIDDLLNIRAKDLGRRPEGLGDLLTEVALGSPAVLAARTMAPARLRDDARRTQSLRMADAFWRMFNRPAVIKLLGQLATEDDSASREEGYYWRLVLRYCRDGNLQSVLDEAWHLAWEQHAWSPSEAPEAAAAQTVTELAHAIEPKPSRVHASSMSTDGSNGILRDQVRLRTDFALRFGDIRTEERVISQDRVRAAFNSPFRPFVLASTSVGQEGLDFHPWCHRLVHWNLPGNPVDLEQREGRIHRYKGHAVRSNVAATHSEQGLATWQEGDDLWSLIFDLAEQEARAAHESDLIPYWIAPGECRVQRYVPLLPYSKEVEAFRRLKRQLAAYRVVFGQPRQEELVTLLDQGNLDPDHLRNWAVDLSPPPE